MSWCQERPGGVRLALLIQPNAKKTEVVGVQGDALKLKLQAAPIEGKANEALVRYLAQVLDVARSSVRVTHGLTNKRKLVEVDGLAPPAVLAALKTPGSDPRV